MRTYIYIAVGVFVLTIMGFFWFQNRSLKIENQNLHENEGTYKAQIKLLADNIAIKDKDIELCNARTQMLKQEGDRRATKAEKARQEAQKLSQKHKELADKLADKLIAQKRLEGKSECEAAKEIFNEYLDLRTKDEATATPR